MPRHSPPEPVRVETLARLLENGGNVSQTARETGISRQIIQRWRNAILASGEVADPASFMPPPSVAERAPMTREQVLHAIEEIANTDTREVMGWDANGDILITPSDQLTKAQARIVAGVKVKRRRIVTGRGDDAEEWETEEIEFKFRDQLGALMALARMPHVGLVPPPGVKVELNDNRQQAFVNVPTERLEELAQAIIGIAEVAGES